MTIPVDAKSASPRPVGAAREMPPTAPPARPAEKATRPASIQIDRLIVENASFISPAAIRDGFREAWLREEANVDAWDADVFRRDLSIDLPLTITGLELGRRLAQAILRRARQS